MQPYELLEFRMLIGSLMGLAFNFLVYIKLQSGTPAKQVLLFNLFLFGTFILLSI